MSAWGGHDSFLSPQNRSRGAGSKLLARPAPFSPPSHGPTVEAKTQGGAAALVPPASKLKKFGGRPRVRRASGVQSAAVKPAAYRDDI